MKMQAGFDQDIAMVSAPATHTPGTVNTTGFSIADFHELFLLLLLGPVGAANARMVGTLQHSPDGTTDWQNLLDRDGNAIQYDVTDNVAGEAFASSARMCRVDVRQWPEDRPFMRLSIVITNGTIGLSVGVVTLSGKESPEVSITNDPKMLLQFREHNFIAGNP